MSAHPSGASSSPLNAVPVEPWPDGDGASFRVKVRAGGRRNHVGGCVDGQLRVEVTTAPEKGKANRAVLALLARVLSTAPSTLRVLSGETDARKRIGVAGRSPGEVAASLSALE